MPKILMRRDTAATWAAVNPTLSSGEWALETDTGKMKLGDGQTAWNSLDYYTEEDKEWEKPADWPDIRSGALPNSVYFLVGHSADYTQYPTFSVFVNVSNSGTYDVYVDGLKQATTANNVGTVLNWQTLALTDGYDTTYPSALRTHIVRITPTLSTNTFTSVRLNQTPGNSELVHGLLWVHFTTANAINLTNAFGSAYKTITPILEAATGNIMPNQAATNAFRYSKVKYIDTIDASSATGIESAFFYANNLKSVTITGNNNSIKCYVAFSGCTSLKKVVFRNIKLLNNNATFQNCSALKEISGLQLDSSGADYISPFINCSSFNTPTVLDFSRGVGCIRGVINKTPGIKAITVSPEAPFSNATSPQLDVSYTGLDRSALVTLFQSMPYNVAYEKVGNPTIVDGVASGFSSSDYLRISNMPTNNTLEFVSKINLTSYPSSAARIFGHTWYGRFAISVNNSGILTASFGTAGSFDIGTITGTTNLSLNTDYWIRVIFTGSSYELYYSMDNKNYVLEGSLSSTSFIQGGTTLTVSIGVGGRVTDGGSPFTGSIDLNQTYIKVNGIPWFGPGVTKNLVPGGTLVGSPTVTDGVMSSFSVSKYLTLPSASALNVDTMEWNFVFKTGTVVTPAAIKYLFGYEDWGGLTIRSSGAFGFTWLKKSTYAWEENGSGTIHAEANTTYRCNIVFDNTAGTAVVSVKKADGTSVFSETYSNTNARIYGTPVVGIRGNPSTHADNYFNGSVDLNNSYINVNGSRFWTGMVPQTKTCSVVGCTGTSSLTAADKAIATDKGWSLTVS